MGEHPTALGGTCSARFEPLRELFAAKLESGEDLGASLVFNVVPLGPGHPRAGRRDVVQVVRAIRGQLDRRERMQVVVPWR